MSKSSQEYGFGIRDPGSEIRDPEETYSGSRIQGSKRHRIPDPQHCFKLFSSNLLYPTRNFCDKKILETKDKPTEFLSTVNQLFKQSPTFSSLVRNYNLSASTIISYFFKQQNMHQKLEKATISVADVYPVSRIPDPDFYPFRIPDPKTATKERGEKKLLSNLFL